MFDRKRHKEHGIMGQGLVKNNKLPANGGLRRKLFLLCSLLVITASLAFAVIGILQLRATTRVAAATNASQNAAIMQRSQETITDLTNENMLNTITLTAQNADGEFWTMKHDFTMLALMVQDIFEHPYKYGEREIFPPDPANAGKYALQLIFSNNEAANDPKTQVMVRKLANLEPMMAEIVRGNTDYTRDCYISLPNGATLVMDKESNLKFDEKGKHPPLRSDGASLVYGSGEGGEVLLHTGGPQLFPCGSRGGIRISGLCERQARGSAAGLHKAECVTAIHFGRRRRRKRFLHYGQRRGAAGLFSEEIRRA